MESFPRLHLVPASEERPEQLPKVKKTETTPDTILSKVNTQLREIINGLSLEKNLAGEGNKPRRAELFKRMVEGPSVLTEDADLAPLFAQVAEVESVYGRTAVEEMARYYTGPQSDSEVASTGAQDEELSKAA